VKQSAATVVATFSRRMRLRLDDGRLIEARIKGKKLRPVAGDRVTAAELDNEQDWLIVAVHERDNELARPNVRGEREVLAANVDLLVVVAAATPTPDWFIVDRYLCAAEVMDAQAAVVFNKVDLVGVDRELLKVYEALGYATIATSADSGENVDRLGQLLRDRTAIIVGQSGVGKSSLINRLTADEQQRTAPVSDKSGEGRHTTVNSVMIALPNGGHVIDSPGVRDYAPALQSVDEVVRGYREVEEASRNCRFANCRHMKEPGCGVKAGVDAGTIDARRYESYRRTLIATERLTQPRY